MKSILAHYLRIMSLALLLAGSFPSQAQAQSDNPSPTTATTQIQIQASAVAADSTSITLKVPGSASNLKVHLNGDDVSSRFSQADCEGATCMTAKLTATDGLSGSKNVIAASAGNHRSIHK